MYMPREQPTHWLAGQVEISETICTRLSMKKQIHYMLRDIPQIQKIGPLVHNMVNDIEKILFSQASSMEEYLDHRTLRKRVFDVIRDRIAQKKSEKRAFEHNGALGANTEYVSAQNSQSNSWMLQHATSVQSQHVDSARAFNGNDRYHNRALQDILQPPRKQLRMTDCFLPNMAPDNGTFLVGNTSMHQTRPPEEVPQEFDMRDPNRQLAGTLLDIVHPPQTYWRQTGCLWYDDRYQQSDLLHFTNNFEGKSTGFIEDILSPPPNNPMFMDLQPLPNSCDDQPTQPFYDANQVAQVLPEIPSRNEWQNVHFGVENQCMGPNLPDDLTIPVDHALQDLPKMNELQNSFFILESGSMEPKMSEYTMPRVDHVAEIYSGLQKLRCYLAELFTPKQIEEHINSAMQFIGQTKAQMDRIQAVSQSTNGPTCQLCAMKCLRFTSLLYCSSCNSAIEQEKTYYAALNINPEYIMCNSCHRKAPRKLMVAQELMYKSKMEKNVNIGPEESWIVCKRCQGSHHQICALFNSKKYKETDPGYLCPKCYLQEIKSGECVSLTQDLVPGAKDLPKTKLSDHLETWLLEKLEKDRKVRAEATGKKLDEVPGAEDLIVRVVLSIEKKTQVKPRFLRMFAEENYPEEFPYKSKVILLFQKIEGIDVCLFAMYVQEYGTMCESPNNRCVYISYLDSVKYFQPDIKAANGEALRTVAYHELLIAYLDYCKKRGFTTCYIWACPLPKGDNYILHCHPEIQKAPKDAKYKLMLEKAKRENIVVAVTNLHDHFISIRRKCNSTPINLPYFDGDYWPQRAEFILSGPKHTSYRCYDLRNKAKKETSIKTFMRYDLMQKLEEYIGPSNKEKFMMVHLQCFCKHCYQPILYGRLWFCYACDNFQLCNWCYSRKQGVEEKCKHPTSRNKKHDFSQREVNIVDTILEDDDETIYNEIFDDRQNFLSFCQDNLYQHDMLRRAKHSWMMILYHLHNPNSAVPINQV